MHHTLIVLCFVCATLSTFATEIYDGDVSSKCMHNCYKNRTDFGDICSTDELECHQQCEYGCHMWKESLSNSCQLLCNSTNVSLTAKQIYCLIGCNDGVVIFRDKMQSHLGTPPPPVLVADSLTSTSLQLEWNYKKAAVTGLKFLIQWRYEEVQEWLFFRKPIGMSKDSIFTVDDLQPYTKYRFRVAILIYQLSEPVYSTASVVIMTLPEGAPASSPSSVRAVPVDCTRISVSWEPGAFPNGPILSYVVGITELNTNISSFKDVPAEKNFDILSSLRPGSNYNVSVSLMNSDGIGPAAFASVATPIETTVNDTQGPVLIIGTDREIVEQGVEIMDEPINLYNTEIGVTIKGVAIHVKYKLLFISDSNRYIYKMPLSKEANSRRIPVVLPLQIDFQPLDLTVDWLNEQLYILAERNYQEDSYTKIWSIMKCGLDGEGLTVAVGGLTIKPHHIEVDPYNGYLFWILDERYKSNLYKLDLSDISNGIKHENHPELIFSEKNLGAFIVDHTNFMLLVSNQDNKTVNSVSLDGKEVHDVRPKISNSILEKVISLATANKKFYWTDGKKVFCEEYHEGDQTYFHNSFSALMKASYLKVIINMPSSQPVPVPVNPPTQIQAIFGSSRAKTTWKVPHLLGGQGKGAWQNWSYELSVKNAKTNITQTFRNINLTSFTVGNLTHDSEYVVRAFAYTSSGKGPWSSEFRGRTWKHMKHGNPVILWSAFNGLSKSDEIGGNIEVLIDRSRLNNSYITDSAWYRDEVYLLTNISEIFIYNLTSRQEKHLPKLDNSIKSIAIDWIGRKLYWSKQQWIMRGNLTGGSKEPPLPATATELVIDSIRAYIYWSTGYAITCSRLNGDTKTIQYYANKEFSGKRVMGLTLDKDNKYLYWIVRGSEGSNLFRAPLAGGSRPPNTEQTRVVSSLPKADIKGSLSYFNNRFLWLQDDDNAIISNLEGRNIAVVNEGSLSALNMVTVIDPALQQLSAKSKLSVDDVNVIPDSVDYASVKVFGAWDSFNITWRAVDNVNFGNVLYEVKFHHEDYTKIVDRPTIKYPVLVRPFSKFSVTIRAFTYWASSTATKINLHSPSSTPSEPQNLRAYVTYNRNFGDLLDIKLTLRWDSPINSNGVIERYKVSGWIHHEVDGATDNPEDTLDVCNDFTSADNKEFVLNNLFKDKIYYFEVRAYTASEGLSAKIEVDTSVENPIPTLIIASEDSIYVEDLDVNTTVRLMHGISTPLEVAVLMRENKLFWLNDMQELFMYDMDRDVKSKIFDMNSNVISLTVDWLERSLYYIELRTDIEGSSVYKLDLNLVEKNILKPAHVLRTPSRIARIEVSPFTKKLYWVETDQNSRNLIMECSTNGSNVRPFFNQDPECQCPILAPIEKVLAVDHSNQQNRPSLIFVESSSIIAADQHGCNCTKIVDFEMSSENSSLKSDLSHMHWIDSLGKVLHTYERQSGIVKNGSTNAREILIYGKHVQPYPPKKCLMPELHKQMSVALVNRTSSSLTLGMPDVGMLEDCMNISYATIQYRVYYMPYNDDDQCDKTCDLVTTFEKTVTINGLRPYSKYVFSLQLSNYYISLEEDDTNIIGQGLVFQTAVGAPSEPRNVTVTILNPTLLKVSWSPPEEFNGDTIHYEIHWQTEATLGIIQKGEQKVKENDINFGREPFTAFLQKMTQNETYIIWVRAYSGNNESLNDSNSVKVTTFPEPDNLTLTNYTAYSLSVDWTISGYLYKYSMQYTLLTSHEWQEVPNDSIDSYNGTIQVNIGNLKPKTQYKFRFLLQYPEDENDYIWPQDARFTFETKGDRPTPPGRPEIRFVNGNESKIWWQPSKDNGSPIQLYKLEGLKLRYYRQKRSTNRTAWSHSAPSIDEEIFEWDDFYNGTETYWKVEGLNDDFRYAFRASALNEYGWSDPSEDIVFDPTTAAELAGRQNPLHMILIAIVVPVLFLVLVTVMCWACCRWNCSKNKKDAHIIAPLGRPDVELATLRELPRRGNFIQNTNVLYVSAQPTPEEIKQLPHIRRDQITLTQFLGSGAFGEVYEGIARGVAGNSSDIRVAVKTLRKGASDPEKTEFLQEAQLMSHFKHKHILQLLGVCLDNDPHYIIMELMEGGDLLTYLRSSRNTSNQTHNPALTLVDLLMMCVDVTTGCRYLEEMHFVHRDLACRNCLVSSTDPETRIVKIGDFGLARDIYKNDYYRKEGEGLLPVRWMAPESLVDGVFTSQSDVWSFGVLLWEIMTLGQQPYPARNNFEVLHYVRRGGRLGKPTDCPEKLHELMLMCWSFEPERRPTFKYCLDTLTKLHEQVLRSPVTGAHNGQYISTVPEHFEGISNLLYFQDLNHNNSGTSWTSNDSSKEKTPFLNSSHGDDGPKYLEVVHDGTSEENDGYEIPRNGLLSGDSEDISNDSAGPSGRDNVALNIESTTKSPYND